MNGQRPVSLLETIVLRDIVEIIASNHDRSLHLHFRHDAVQYAAANAHVARERAFFIDVRSLDRFARRFEAQADASHESALFFRRLPDQAFLVFEYGRLLLVSAFRLRNSASARHVVDSYYDFFTCSDIFVCE